MIPFFEKFFGKTPEEIKHENPPAGDRVEEDLPKTKEERSELLLHQIQTLINQRNFLGTKAEYGNVLTPERVKWLYITRKIEELQKELDELTGEGAEKKE